MAIVIKLILSIYNPLNYYYYLRIGDIMSINELTNTLKTLIGTNSTDIIYSIFMVFFSSVLYYFLKFTIQKNGWSIEKKRKHLATIRNTIILISVLFMLFIWSGHLKTFIFSAAAIFSALLVIFRELILSIVGTVVSNKNFYVGDYIEYDGRRGLIMDKTLFTTKIMVINSDLDETLSFPNMLYLSSRIINIPKFGMYIMNELFISIDCDNEKIKRSVDSVNKSVELVFKDYIGKSEEYIEEKIRTHKILTKPSVIPEITYDFSDSKNYKIKVIYLCHPNDIKTLNKQIHTEYINNITT